MTLSNLPAREEFLRKRRKKRLIITGIICVSVVLFVALIAYIFHRPQIRIHDIELSGEVLLTKDEVKEETLYYLNGSYLWLFPKDSFFLYPKGSLENFLREHFQRIDTISISKKDWQTITIKITERKPFAIWCSGDPISNNCFFMDVNSTIFSQAPNFSGDAYFKYYGLLNTDSPIGMEYIASTTVFTQISQFAQNVKDIGIHPQYIVAKDQGQFSVILSGGGEIYFDVKEPVEKLTENLVSLLKSPDLKPNGDNLPVQYIDLRYGNKLFYKLK